MTGVLARWENLFQQVEEPFAAAIVAEKNRYIEAASQSFPVHGRLVESEFDTHASRMMGIAERYDSISIRLALAESFKGKAGPSWERKDWWDRLWHFLLQQWTQTYGAPLARETAETTRDDMQRIINVSLRPDAEFNPVAVAAELLAARDLSKFRAEVIALTEVHSAMMFASEQGAAKISRDTGAAMLKKWLPVRDERTRVNHAAMSGHPAIPLDADFTVGGVKMSRPGDPRGGPQNTIRCRCVLTYEAGE